MYHSFFCSNIRTYNIIIFRVKTSLGDGKDGESFTDAKRGDVYESISDEELELFDDNEEDVKLPQPASVMEVDWSLLSKMNAPAKTEGE